MPEDVSKATGLQTQLFVYDSRGGDKKDELSAAIKNINTDVILVAHSMGGLLSIDAVSTAEKVIGIISIDTPFFSLDPGVHSVVSEPLKKIASSGWGFAGLALGGVLAAAAYSSGSDELKKSIGSMVSNHLTDTTEFLSPLWNVSNMRPRFEVLQSRKIYFSGIYLELENKRFCNLPPSDLAHHFTALPMTGRDVVDCHMNMFQSNRSSYAELLMGVRTRLDEAMKF